MKSDCHGTTLIELLMVLSLISILTLSGGRAFLSWLDHYYVNAAVKQMEIALKYAQRFALNQSVILCHTSDGQNCETSEIPQYLLLYGNCDQRFFLNCKKRIRFFPTLDQQSQISWKFFGNSKADDPVDFHHSSAMEINNGTITFYRNHQPKKALILNKLGQSHLLEL